MENTLYYGDNLDIMRRYLPDESVDLVYADPPFKSNQNYNVLFQEKDGSQAASQIRAFEDTWVWDQEDEAVYADLVTAGGKVADALQAFRQFIGPCDMLSYLVMMAPRLVECRRALKPSGSMYLHCDPAASHYLKMLMDAVFGPENFLNEISWKRTYSHGSAKRYGPIHDVILFYAKSDAYFWNGLKSEHDPEYIEKHFRYMDETTGKKFQAISLTGAGVRNGESGKPWRGVDPTAVGRHWALPGKIVAGLKIEKTSVQQSLDALDAAGRIYWPKKDGGTPRLKWYADDTEGVAVPDMWTDIGPISAQAAERLGYPTQKPVALLERIIRSSCPEGGIVFDPFCGCGTTIAAAQTLGRTWIGIDITHLAITLMKERLKDTFGEAAQFQVVGEPTSIPDAAALAASDPYQFQWWALGLVGARPLEEKKGADKGIDGKIIFQGDAAGKFESVILSVKAGHVTANHVRDLRGVVEREKAAIGVLIAMEDFTGPMETEAVTAGFHESKTWGKRYPKIQLLTVADLLAGKSIEMPPVKQVGATFKKAPRARKASTQADLPLTGGGGPDAAESV